MDLESYRELREFKDKEVKGVNEGRGDRVSTGVKRVR